MKLRKVWDWLKKWWKTKGLLKSVKACFHFGLHHCITFIKKKKCPHLCEYARCMIIHRLEISETKQKCQKCIVTHFHSQPMKTKFFNVVKPFLFICKDLFLVLAALVLRLMFLSEHCFKPQSMNSSKECMGRRSVSRNGQKQGVH